jgi:glycerate-2-kinase
MVSVAREVLGDKVAGGICIVPDNLGGTIPDIDVYEASHPVPDERGIEATKKVIEIISNRGPADLILFFISGGGSSLLVSLPEGISLADIQQLNKVMYSNSLSISEINTVRRHVSTIKGGGVLRYAKDARVVTVIISNVLGNSPRDIASGPTVIDNTNFCDALSIIIRRKLMPNIPGAIAKHLKQGAFGLRTDTFKRILVHERYRDPILLASSKLTRKIARDYVESYGMNAYEIKTSLRGDAAAAGRAFASVLTEIYIENKANLPICVIASGSLELPYDANPQLTGRNQEFAVAAAISGVKDIPFAFLLAGNTGGEDNIVNSKYSGAIVSSKTAVELEARKLDTLQALKENRVTPLLEEIQAVFKNGKNFSNLLDLVIAVIAEN